MVQEDEPDAHLVVPVPAHGYDTAPWRQAQKGGSREDRTLRQVTVSLPPMIRDYETNLPSQVVQQTESALTAITRLDSAHGGRLAALSVLLLRAESVASSKIEHPMASAQTPRQRRWLHPQPR